MTFDLYGNIGLPTKPATTTMDALAAAEWTCPNSEGKWHLMWDDRTDYGNEPDGGFFHCDLYERGDRWVYEIYHSVRAFEDERELETRVWELEVEDVLAICKVGALAYQMERWEQGMEEYRQRMSVFDDNEDEEDFSLDPEAEALARGELYL